MNTLIHLSEILGTIDDGRTEILADADATYDSSTSQVSVTLHAFARHVVALADGKHLPQPWLPPRDIVTEHLPREDASSFARDVFHSWTQKVRGSIPPSLCLRQTQLPLESR